MSVIAGFAAAGIALGMVLLLLTARGRAEERYRAFITHSTEGIWRVELEESLNVRWPVERQLEHLYRHAYLAECNDAMARMYGFPSAGAFVGARFEDFVERSRAENLEVLRRFLGQGYRVVDVESFERDRSGRPKVFLSTKVGMVKGDFLRSIWGTQRDITEQKRVEQALDRSQERFRLLIESSSDIVAIVNGDGRMRYVSPSAGRVFGYPADTLAGRTVLHLVHPQDRWGALVFFKRLLARSGATPYFQCRVRHANGSWRVAETVGRNLLDDPTVAGLVVNVRDITRQKAADDALREAQERFRKAFDESPIGMALISVEGLDPVAGNRALAAFLGYSPEQLLSPGMVRRLSHPEDLETDFDLARRLLAGEIQSYRLEKRYRHAEGHWVWGLLHRSLVRDAAGQPLYLLAHVQDITEQRRMAERAAREREALRRSEERYRALFDDNPSMYFTVDANGTVLSVNRLGADQLGYGTKDLRGRSVLEVFHPADRDAVRRGLAACVAEPGMLHRWEFRKVRRDGSILWVAEAARAVADSDGRPVVFIVCEDVTPRKEAERQQARLQADVRRSAVEWRLTFDAIEAPIVIVDRALHVARLNEAARRHAAAGRDFTDLIGRPLADLAGRAPWARAVELAGDVGRSGAPAAAQMRDIASGRTWDIAASPVGGAEAGQERILVVARDITELVRLQESLRRSETMSAMGALVAGVAHEVRNPLFSMSATLDAFEARHGRRDEYGRHFRVLRAQLTRLTQLMQELLEYGKPPTLDLTRHLVADTIAQAVEACSVIAREHRVSTCLALEDGHQRIPMDRRRMIQVFTNLLENAIQHSPAGADVHVTAARIDERYLEVTVADEGSGFSAEDLDRIFEPFFTRRRDGTGLGLSLVQRIVEQHGGTVTAANRPTGGAEVRVRFPLTAAPPAR